MSDKKLVGLPAQKPANTLPYDEIKEAIGKIHFGIVQLIIQDGRVVQIDTTEKRRLV